MGGEGWVLGHCLTAKTKFQEVGRILDKLPYMGPGLNLYLLIIRAIKGWVTHSAE